MKISKCPVRISYTTLLHRVENMTFFCRLPLLLRSHAVRGTVRTCSTAARPQSGAPLTLRPIANGPVHFGREVVGIDLASEEQVTAHSEEFVSALYEHGLLLFRDQQHLTPSDEMRFACDTDESDSKAAETSLNFCSCSALDSEPR